MDSCHYNSSTSEKCHYNSAILKFTIIIFHTSESCHFIHLLRAWARCQTVYVYVYFVWTKTPLLLYSLHSMTCGPHSSGSSSTSVLVLAAAAGSRRRAAAQAPRGEGGGGGAAAGSPPAPLLSAPWPRAEAAAATCAGEGGGISRPPLLAPGRSRAAAAPAARRAGRRTGLLVPLHRGSAPTPGRRTSALPRLRAAAPPPRRRAPTSHRSCPASPLTPAILFLPGHTSSLPSRSAAELAGPPPLTLPLRSSRRSSG